MPEIKPRLILIATLTFSVQFYFYKNNVFKDYISHPKWYFIHSMFCILTDQLAQIKEITHAKVLCSVLKDDYGDISYQARLFERQHRDRLVVMKNMRFRDIKKKFCVFLI